jgi:hypothetical protein
MLDFAKTIPSDVVVKHNVPYEYPSTSPEDGYLIGLENLLNIVESIDVGPTTFATKPGVDTTEIANAILD